MKFGPLATDQAEGTILAHATIVGDRKLKKSHLLTAEDVAQLKAYGVEEVIVAKLADDDLDENTAASRVAQALQMRGVVLKPAATGRVNIHALKAGVFTVDRFIIDAVNRVDPSITVATLLPFVTVNEGQMVATVKIIPFAVPAAIVNSAVSMASGAEAIAVHSFRPMSVAVVQTVLPSIKPSVLDKTVQVTAVRLARSGGRVGQEIRVPHRQSDVRDAVSRLLPQHDMVIVFGASAMSDPDDVIPAAIREAGGDIIRAGMPVDPGNLIVVGHVYGKPVLGAPGCARSSKENGFDWVLDRLIAGLKVTGDDIAAMGVGGLLMEIATRPQPRDTAQRPVKVHAVVLAAGTSSRMGGPNKLLARFEGEALVRRVTHRARLSRADGVTLVTGHQADEVEQQVAGEGVEVVRNPDFADGLSTSLKAGIAAVPERAGGALIMLGDMPDVSTEDLDRLIAAFAETGGSAIVRASSGGRRGNPVILPRQVFAEIVAIDGDAGARSLIESGRFEIIDVDIGPAAMIDVDTPEALEKAGGLLAH